MSRSGARGVPDAETPAAMLERVGLAGSERSWPYQLSGGMAQRVGLARAFVRKPAVLLLDEPFAALDAFTRLQMGDLLREICRDRSRTVLLVTHDVDEALRLADRIVLLGGKPASIIAEYATAGHDAEPAARRDPGSLWIEGGGVTTGAGRVYTGPDQAMAPGTD